MRALEIEVNFEKIKTYNNKLTLKVITIEVNFEKNQNMYNKLTLKVITKASK